MDGLLAVQAGDLTVAELCEVLDGKLGHWQESALRESDVEGAAELLSARERLAETQMWATRGMAKFLGVFAPADLERVDGQAFLVGVAERGLRVCQASDLDAARAVVEAHAFGEGAEVIGALDGS